jgi:2-haloacid dehalogenase
MDVPEVLLLDVNETLTDLEPLRLRFADVGAPESLLDRWFAATLRDGFALTAADAFASFGDVAAGVLQTLLPSYGVDDVPAAVRHVLGGFAELPVHADVVPGLTRLHAAGVRLVTLTNGSVATSAPVLERAGLLPMLEQRLSVDDAGRWKPHREAYLYALGVSGVDADRAALVAVHPWDVDGALRTGLRGVWVDRHAGTYPPVFTPPTLTVRGFDDLADALGA